MNTATKISELLALTVDLLQSNGCLVYNLFADLWKEIRLKSLLSKVGVSKRTLLERSNMGQTTINFD